MERREGKWGANRYDLFMVDENRSSRLNEPARPCKILLTAPMNPISFRHCISRHRQPDLAGGGEEGIDGEMDRWIDKGHVVGTAACRLTPRIDRDRVCVCINIGSYRWGTFAIRYDLRFYFGFEKENWEGGIDDDVFE